MIDMIDMTQFNRDLHKFSEVIKTSITTTTRLAALQIFEGVV